MDIKYKLDDGAEEATDNDKVIIVTETITSDSKLTIRGLRQDIDAIQERAANKAQEFQDQIDAKRAQIAEIKATLKI